MSGMGPRPRTADHDTEKYGAPAPYGGVNPGYGEQQTRPVSRLSLRTDSAGLEPPNYSRPVSRQSTSNSISNDVTEWPRQSQSSELDRGQTTFRRAKSAEVFRSPVSGRLPPFAPKTGMPLEGPPIRASSPLSASGAPRQKRSMDVMEAANKVRWEEPPWNGSTRSLLSTIKEKSDGNTSTFARRVFEAGKPDLLYDLRTTNRMKDHVHGVLDLTTLARMSQHVAQQKLVEQVKIIGEKGAWMEIGIQQTLHEYCDALRDIDYMERCANRGMPQDPFLLSTAKPLDCQLLEDAGIAFGNPKKNLAQKTPIRLATTKRQSASKRGLRRLLMAVLGSLAIIAPFLIMVLISGHLVRLIATCAFALAFAVGITIGSELPSDQIALATAAYAAALIIFFGASPRTYHY